MCFGRLASVQLHPKAFPCCHACTVVSAALVLVVRGCTGLYFYVCNAAGLRLSGILCEGMLTEGAAHADIMWGGFSSEVVLYKLH